MWKLRRRWPAFTCKKRHIKKKDRHFCATILTQKFVSQRTFVLPLFYTVTLKAKSMNLLVLFVWAWHGHIDVGVPISHTPSSIPTTILVVYVLVGIVTGGCWVSNSGVRRDDAIMTWNAKNESNYSQTRYTDKPGIQTDQKFCSTTTLLKENAHKLCVISGQMLSIGFYCYNS